MRFLTLSEPDICWPAHALSLNEWFHFSNGFDEQTFIKSKLGLQWSSNHSIGHVGMLNGIHFPAVQMTSLWYCELWIPLGLPVPCCTAWRTHTWDFCVTVQFLLFWQPPFYPPDFRHIEISLSSQGGHELDLTICVDLKEWVCTQPPFLWETFKWSE